MTWGWPNTARTLGSKWDERLGRVVGIEARLVPLVGEPLGQLVPRLVAVPVPHVRVHVEMCVVVTTLEVLMGQDGRGHLGPDVGPQDLCGDPRVVGHRHRLADVMTEGGDHQLVVGTGPLGPGRRLQAVGQLVHGEPVDHVGQGLQHGQDPVGHPALVADRFGADDRPLLAVDTSMLVNEVVMPQVSRQNGGSAPIAAKSDRRTGHALEHVGGHGGAVPGQDHAGRLAAGLPVLPLGNRHPIEEAQGRREAPEQVAQLGGRGEVLVLVGDGDLSTPSTGARRATTASTSSSGADAPAVTPTVPERSSGSSRASLTRSTRGHPEARATFSRARVLEEFTEPMTTTASARPAMAFRAAWRLVVAKHRSDRLGIQRSGNRSRARSMMPDHSSWLRVVWASSATGRRPPSVSRSSRPSTSSARTRATDAGRHRHRADRLLVALVADVEDGVALAGPDLELVVDLGDERADGVDHHPAPVAGRGPPPRGPIRGPRA